LVGQLVQLVHQCNQRQLGSGFKPGILTLAQLVDRRVEA